MKNFRDEEVGPEPTYSRVNKNRNTPTVPPVPSRTKNNHREDVTPFMKPRTAPAKPPIPSIAQKNNHREDVTPFQQPRGRKW
jgi:hypothetical protein